MEEGQICWDGVYMYTLSIFDTMDLNNVISACWTYGGTTPSTALTIFEDKMKKLGYPELCHNRLDCFCFVLNLVGVEQN